MTVTEATKHASGQAIGRAIAARLGQSEASKYVDQIVKGVQDAARELSQ